MENVILSENPYPSGRSVGDSLQHTAYEDGKQAQARHLLRILKEPCTEHNKSGYITKGCLGDKKVFYKELLRKDCPDCMGQIEKEIEG